MVTSIKINSTKSKASKPKSKYTRHEQPKTQREHMHNVKYLAAPSNAKTRATCVETMHKTAKPNRSMQHNGSANNAQPTNTRQRCNMNTATTTTQLMLTREMQTNTSQNHATTIMKNRIPTRTPQEQYYPNITKPIMRLRNDKRLKKVRERPEKILIASNFLECSDEILRDQTVNITDHLFRLN